MYYRLPFSRCVWALVRVLFLIAQTLLQHLLAEVWTHFPPRAVNVRASSSSTAQSCLGLIMFPGISSKTTAEKPTIAAAHNLLLRAAFIMRYRHLTQEFEQTEAAEFTSYPLQTDSALT